MLYIYMKKELYITYSKVKSYIYHLFYPLFLLFLTCALLSIVNAIIVKKSLSALIAISTIGETLFILVIFLLVLYSILLPGLSCFIYSPAKSYFLTVMRSTRSTHLQSQLQIPAQSSLYGYLVKMLLEKGISFFSYLLKKITFSRVMSTTITIVLVASLRYLYFGGLIVNPLDLSESICWAWCAAMFKLILEGVLSEQFGFIKMGGDQDITINDKSKRPIKPIKIEYTTFAMENEEENEPSGESSSNRPKGPSTTGSKYNDYSDKKKETWYKFEKGEISKEAYEARINMITHLALEEVANKAAAYRLDTETRMMLGTEQINMVQKHRPGSRERQEILAHFLSGFPDKEYGLYVARQYEEWLIEKKKADSTKIESASKSVEKLDLNEDRSDKSEKPESKSPSQ